MTDKDTTGANHVMEAINRVVNDEAECRPLPKTLFLQVDKCWTENMNKYVMSYIEFFVQLVVCDNIEVALLPLGHTYPDIDQAFRTTSRSLDWNDAIKLTELHEQLSKCYNDRTIVTKMKNFANWSGLCDKSGVILPMHHITGYR